MNRLIKDRTVGEATIYLDEEDGLFEVTIERGMQNPEVVMTHIRESAATRAFFATVAKLREEREQRGWVSNG
ncbi:L-rhamnose mutarotase [Arthrobacter sp. UYEF6]